MAFCGLGAICLKFFAREFIIRHLGALVLVGLSLASELDLSSRVTALLEIIKKKGHCSY